MSRSARANEWGAVALITLGAAALRLIDLGSVRLDPFYDAAVRSMALSWHNFFVGAFEPGGSVSIDKPPLDLWLQVASVKLLGFHSTALKLPEALAGTASVPLLFAAVRRAFSVPAALAAALAMAVLPVEVITARSDTMDALMMALVVLCLLLVIRASESGHTAWLLAAAATLGLAFNVKLLESVVALPGLTVLAYLGLPGPPRRRALMLGAAAAVFVAVALSWLTATSLLPGNDRPFAIGSTNGSAWNAAFVFNGSDRLTGKTIEGPQASFQSGHRYAQATQRQRDAIPITPPSPTRLLDRVGPLSGRRLGIEVLAALLLGVPAVAFGLVGERRAHRRIRAGGEAPAPDEDPEQRVRRATMLGLAIWLLTGIVLFSYMVRLHPRYVESFTPAVAAMFGIGAAWAAGLQGRARLLTLAGALVVLISYAEHLSYGTPDTWWIALGGALGAIVVAVLAGRRASTPALRTVLGAPGVLALTTIAVLAIPLHSSIEAIEAKTSDAGNVGALPHKEQRLISAYLRAHEGTARYEVAADSATKVSSLIVADARPVVVLTTYGARTLTSVAKLEALSFKGEVRYAFLSSPCGPHTPRTNAGCSAPAQWVRAHATDVSRQAGLNRSGVLWRLPAR